MAEHLAELSIESLTINTILSRRRNTSTKQSDDESIESFSDSFTFIKKDSCAIKAKSVILDRTDRNGEILEIGDRVTQEKMPVEIIRLLFQKNSKSVYIRVCTCIAGLHVVRLKSSFLVQNERPRPLIQ